MNESLFRHSLFYYYNTQIPKVFDSVYFTLCFSVKNLCVLRG